jgi:hypothetical protein
MRKTTLVSSMAAGLALLLASGAFAAAVNPAAPNPYPTRDGKLLVDFAGPVTVMSDPAGTGKNLASINTDPQFTALGTKSLKLDLDGVSGYYGANLFVTQIPTPVDITGYRVLGMDVFLPDASIESSWYQLDLNATTTNPGDDTMTTTTSYSARLINTHTGWNHVIWNLKNGTDTKITQLAFGGNSGAPYHGPIYVDNIRVYKGDFVGLQPDEKLIFGFDNPTDASLFTSGDGAPITGNTDKQFISQGDGSLKIDLTGLQGTYSSSFAGADALGITFDASKATALHLDLFAPTASAPNSWHLLGFRVTGDGGSVAMDTGGYVDGQWNTLEIPLTPDQAAMLTNVTGVSLIRNSGDIWNGPIYIDNLRAVIPTP